MTAARVDSDLRATPAPLTAGSRVERFAIMAAVVGLWMVVGWVLKLGAVAYLLTGIPLTIAFQVLVARRPIPSLWLIDARSFHLDRAGIVIALGLAALPLYATAMGLASGRILDVGYGLAGVLGSAPAAFALRATNWQARRALLRSLLTAGVVASVLFLLNRLISPGPPMTDPVGALGAVAISLVLYIPLVFVIEEVFFRGALDTYARGPERTTDMASAIFVSLLWGAWHLPLVLADGRPGGLPITLAFHLIVGLLLTLPWRRSGNLAVPGITHAVIDAIRDGIAAA
jgi:membrane protease YdiL (CAAX protease family)